MHRRETLFPHPYSLMSPWRLKSLWQLPASWRRPPFANHPPICGLRGRAKAGAPLGPQPLWGQGRMRLASSPSPMVPPPLTIGGGFKGNKMVLPTPSITMVWKLGGGEGRGSWGWPKFGDCIDDNNMYEAGEFNDTKRDGGEVGNAIGIKNGYLDEIWNHEQFTYDLKAQDFVGVLEPILIWNQFLFGIFHYDAVIPFILVLQYLTENYK